MSDQIDFSQAVMGNRESPDIRQYPILAPITRVHFAASPQAYERGNVGVEFQYRDLLTPVDLGHAGLIAWTLWFGFFRGGQWVFAPMVECIRAYIPTGALFDANQVANNLLYYADALDPRIARYQPQPGEQIAVVATTGDTRRMSKHAGPEKRTTVVLVPFQVGDYRFDGVSQPPAPEPVPTPAQPVPPPIPPSGIPNDPELKKALGDVIQWLKKIDGTLNQLLEVWK